MKKCVFSCGLTMLSVSIFAQAPKWTESGNTISPGAFIGTINAMNLEFRVNNIPYLNIAPDGIFKFHGMAGTGNAIYMLNAGGQASRLNFDGNSNNVLHGDGTFAAINNAAGWFFSGGGITWTNNKVGIGGISSPVELLEVNGNAIFNGNISAQQFLAGDVVNANKQLRISSSLCMKGFDASIPGSRSEICAMGHDLYIQSTPLLNFNTIVNHANTGSFLVGLTAPTAGDKFEVNGNSRINGNFYVTGETFYTGKSHFERITGMPGDTVIHIGDSSVVIDHINNRVYAGSSSGLLFIPKGLGLGSATATATGTASVAIGRNVKATAANAIIIGNGSGLFTNSTNNSLMVGFNSTVPTFFVGPSAGGATTGFIGMGTAFPEDRLQVRTGGFKLSFGEAPAAELNFATNYIGFNAVHLLDNTWKTETDGHHNGGSVIYSNVVGSLYFATLGTGVYGPETGNQTGISNTEVNAKTRMFINGVTGDIGIGTTCIPENTKLAVEGTIRARRAVIETVDWCDFVFGASYKPLSVNDLENYLKTYAHLPNFKAEEYYIENGVDMVETQKALLKTVEEEALYIIELKKELDVTKAELQLLKEMVLELKNK